MTAAHTHTHLHTRKKIPVYCNNNRNSFIILSHGPFTTQKKKRSEENRAPSNLLKLRLCRSFPVNLFVERPEREREAERQRDYQVRYLFFCCESCWWLVCASIMQRYLCPVNLLLTRFGLYCHPPNKYFCHWQGTLFQMCVCFLFFPLFSSAP